MARPTLTIEQTDALATKVLMHCMDRGILTPARSASIADTQDHSAVIAVILADYHQLRERLYATFNVPATTLTPIAARVLFGLAALYRPRRVAVCGCYAGNLMAWVAGPGFGPFSRYHGYRAVGIDVDPEAITLASTNFAQAGFCAATTTAVGDAFDTGQYAEGGPWDLLLVDIDVPGARKSGYARLVEAWLPLLSADALVIAHDIAHPVFSWDLRTYPDFVLAHGAVDSATLPIDACGLEVTRWRPALSARDQAATDE
jgi:predicted O-methyltransferase YrrM